MIPEDENVTEPIIVAIVAGIITNFIATILFFKDKELKESLKENVSKKDVIRKAYAIVGIVVNVGVSVWIATNLNDNGTIFLIKNVIMLSILWPVALIDLRTTRIPNRFVLYGLIARACVLISEIFFKSNTLKVTIITELIAVGVLLGASILCSICIKNSIGFGDMKLFIVMGLLLGLEGIWNAIFLAMFVMFVIAVVLLLTKKKSKKETTEEIKTEKVKSKRRKRKTKVKDIEAK